MWPKRYFTGLETKKLVNLRKRELLKRRTTPYSKLGLAKTNTFVKKPQKKSKWTLPFHKVYPDLKFNKGLISQKTGIPRQALDTVYNRGLKAWKTSGSRVGANPHQWAIARVYKFVLVSKKKAKNTRFDPNQDLRNSSY